MKFKVTTLLAASLLGLTACGGSKGVSIEKFMEEAKNIKAEYYAKATFSFSYKFEVTGAASLGGKDGKEEGSGTIYLLNNLVENEGVKINNWQVDSTKTSPEDLEKTDNLEFVSYVLYSIMVNLKTSADEFDPEENQEEPEEGLTVSYYINPFKMTQKYSISKEEEGMKMSMSQEMTVAWNSDGNLNSLKAKMSESIKGSYEEETINFKQSLVESYTITYSEPMTNVA